MILFLNSTQLAAKPKLERTMFRDRARQFRDRNGWDVNVNGLGEERDQYDERDPMYVVWQEEDGSHGGSMRFLPTSGPTMLSEHFPDLQRGAPSGPDIWEATRFCKSPSAQGGVSAAILAATLEMGLCLGLRGLVGVFDGRMQLVYRRIGWAPELLNRDGVGRKSICSGFWSFEMQVRKSLAKKAGVSLRQIEEWASVLPAVQKAA